MWRTPAYRLGEYDNLLKVVAASVFYDGPETAVRDGIFNGVSIQKRITTPVVDAAFSASETTVGHVDYVTNGPGKDISSVRFLLEVLSNSSNIALLVVGWVALIGAVVGYLLVRPAARDLTAFRRMLREYGDLVPLILRLSVGVPLIGAGVSGYLFTPVVPAPTRLLGIGVGFFVLFGLLTRCAAAVGLLAYLGGLAVEPRLLLASEYAFGFLAIVLFGSGRPSVDQLFKHASSVDGTVCCRLNPIRGIDDRLNRQLVPDTEYALTTVRLGLGFTFVYLGLTQKILDPGRAI